jgi:hypothetical protein
MDTDSDAVPYFYAWITADTDDYADALCAKLVRRGFYVGPMGRMLVTKREDSLAHVIAVVMYRRPRDEAEEKEYNVMGIHAEIADAVKQLKGKFWSLIVSKASACTWNIGAVKLNDDQRVAALAKKLN